MTALVSFVGMQPAAVATAIATWSRVGDLGPILLVATERTKAIAERLNGWSVRSMGRSCDIVNFESGGDEETSGAYSLGTQIASRFGQNLAFNCGPGRTADVVAFAAALSRSCLLLYPDSEELHVWKPDQNAWSAYQTVDLSLDELLALHGLNYTHNRGAVAAVLRDAGRETSANRIERGLHLEPSRQPVVFDLAQERRGFLYAVVAIMRSDLPQEKRLKKLRGAERIANDLNGLRPIVTIVSDVPNVLSKRGKRQRQALNPHERRGRAFLSEWLAGDVRPPGHLERPLVGAEGRRTMYSFEELRWQHREQRASAWMKGAGGQGPPLGICLGNDPSSTLVSIWTHRPSDALIFYDAATSAVGGVAERLRERVASFPVDRARLVPTDNKGSGIADHIAGCGLEKMRVACTPGTKMQKVMLARCESVEPWVMGTAMAHPLLGVGPRLELRAPSTRVQAFIRGGLIQARVQRWSSIVRKEEAALRLLRKFLQAYLEEGADPKLVGDELQAMSCGRGSTSVDGRGLRIAFDRTKARLSTTGPQGRWWELVVASALKDAGCRQIEIGMKWLQRSADAQRYKSRRPVPFTEEIDVVASFGHRFLVVECKTGRVQVEVERRDVESRAEQCFGRMAVPMLARIVCDRQQLKASTTSPGRAVLLDLQTLVDSEALRAHISKAVAARPTISY